MKLPRSVHEQFRRHGRAGGKKRAERLSPGAKKAIAQRGAHARWIRSRFGAASFEALNLPGGELVDRGLRDLAAGTVSVESLVVSLAAPRLRREGVPLNTVLPDPEESLYGLLEQSSGALAHARYGAYLRQAASFADALALLRLKRERRAR